ncbi:hypothetical protein [Pseudomonas sp. NPDC099000]|uniref:hypothetical protein n=1 Tax=Pseudomonas sp. NPDC099000 TaxID=3364488 RepID=UPI00383A7FB9
MWRRSAAWWWAGIRHNASLSRREADNPVWLKQQAGDRPTLLRSNDLNIQATVGAGLAREVWLVVHSDVRHTPSVQAVMGFLASCFEN